MARRMNATSFRKCLEQYAKFNPRTSWVKTFAGFLLGMKGWYSTRSTLTWSLRATKSGRLFFLLSASMRHTDGTEFGLLLPTPVASDVEGGDQRSATDQSEEPSLDQNIGQHGDGVWGKATRRSTNASNTYGFGFLPKRKSTKLEGRRLGFSDAQNHTTGWENFPTQSPIRGGDDGLPKELDGITFPKWRIESIKAYGNAIVPQVALQIFKAIEQEQLNRARR